MKQSEIKNLSLEDLRDKLVESQKQLTDMRMAIRMSVNCF